MRALVVDAPPPVAAAIAAAVTALLADEARQPPPPPRIGSAWRRAGILEAVAAPMAGHPRQTTN